MIHSEITEMPMPGIMNSKLSTSAWLYSSDSELFTIWTNDD